MEENAKQPFSGRLLIGATGSAAVAALPVYINALRTAFSGTITVLMTHTATTFVSPHMVGLFADRVVTALVNALTPRPAPMPWSFTLRPYPPDVDEPATTPGSRYQHARYGRPVAAGRPRP
jgi:hypothetical protein